MLRAEDRVHKHFEVVARRRITVEVDRAMIEDHYGKWIGADDHQLAKLTEAPTGGRKIGAKAWTGPIPADRSGNRSVQSLEPETTSDFGGLRSGGGEIRTPEGF